MHFNNAFFAHIIASNPEEPRGNKVLSYEYSDKLHNLMLMCSDHHKLIDDDIETYTVQVLHEMKNTHEKLMDDLSQQFRFQHTNIIGFISPIRNQPVSFKDELAMKALFGNKRVKNGTSMTIEIKSSYSHHSRDYWGDCIRQLETQMERKIFSQIEQKTMDHISLFPLAPTPLIIKLGELIGDKVECDVYQRFREPESWDWKDRDGSNFVISRIDRTDKQVGKTQIAIVIALSSDISDNRIPEQYSTIYKINSEDMSIDSIDNKDTLRNFWKRYQEVCNLITNEYGREIKVGLFPAIPVSAAFEIGRRYMSGVYPVITRYDNNGIFVETIKLGDRYET